MNIFLVIYFFGIASCGMQGAKRSQLHQANLTVSSTILNAFGGGLLRDVFVLGNHPALLTEGCIPDICVSLMGAYYQQTSRFFPSGGKKASWFMTVADCLGLGTFISIGVDKAAVLEMRPEVAILSGIITALGGGVLASLLCGETILSVLKKSTMYRIITLIGTIMYYRLRCIVGVSTAQLVVIAFAGTMTLCLEKLFQEAVLEYACRAVEVYRRNEVRIYIPNNNPCGYVREYIPLWQCRYNLHMNRNILFHRIRVLV